MIIATEMSTLCEKLSTGLKAIQEAAAIMKESGHLPVDSGSNSKDILHGKEVVNNKVRNFKIILITSDRTHISHNVSNFSCHLLRFRYPW